MKIKNRKTAILLAGCLTVSNVLSVFAANETEVNKKKAELESQIADKEQQVSSLQQQKNDVLSAIKKLDEKHAKAQENLESLTKQIEEKNSEIEKNSEELEKAKEKEAIQYEDMKKRIQYLYEAGNISMISVILGADDFAEALSRTENFRQLTSYDRKQLEEYKKTCKKIENLEKDLKKEKSDLESYKQSAEEEKSNIETSISKKQAEISQFEAGIDAAVMAQSDLEGELAIQNEILKQLKEEVQNTAGQGSSSSSSGESTNSNQNKTEQSQPETKPETKPDSGQSDSSGSAQFTWPCPASHNVTSPFGDRNSPTAGASSNHKGIDIGAGSGSSIVAAASGTVTVSTYSESAGNYVTIDHGNGFHTVYMHASALYVKAGQKVSAGQQIAAVGSTGYSTGPHLHFGIMKNGVYVNPMNYF
ncbi:murein hydrolase activator EnvC family protein [Blautia sp. Marseille-P3201T]|uniref:murein hydrolase activator EnvC family protein n=1 Tax=Blautia sp. Marseille-P3201T TaxID=1907659 RepID=UPI00093134C0|nr:peptidoglycan DD-metalloendopeptidase family protein [Blautia sp. Marseille-P3201T]